MIGLWDSSNRILPYCILSGNKVKRLLNSLHLLLRIIPEIIKFPFRRTPVLIHLHESLQKYLLIKETFKSPASLCAHTLQRNALMSYDNTFLRITLHIYHRTYVNYIILLLESVHTNLHGIRDFLVIIQKNFLTYYLRHEELCRFVCELFLIKIRRRIRQ